MIGDMMEICDLLGVDSGVDQKKIKEVYIMYI